MMDQDGRPQGSTPPHPHRPRFTGVGFLEAGCRGAARDGVSGVSPDSLPPSAPEGGVPKKPTFVNIPPHAISRCSSVVEQRFCKPPMLGELSRNTTGEV